MNCFLTKHYFLFSIILVVAMLTRLVWISMSPPAVYVDEAAIGYNAYSLSETGRDEYGKPWPVLLRSYGAFSSSLYTVVTAPLVKLLGLNTVSVRLLSVVCGVGLVALVAYQWGLVAGLIVALTPVLIFYSRGAFESTLAVGLFYAGLVMVVSFINRPTKGIRLIISAVLFALSTYAYHAERFISPVIFISINLYLIYRFRRERSKVIFVLVSVAIFLTVSLPLIRVTLTPGANQRLTSLLPGNNNDSSSSFFQRYFAYFSPQNLFSRPDPDRQRSFPELSVFYWWWFFPFIYGAYFWVRKYRKWKEADWLLLFILVLSPLPGAVTKDYFATLRVLPMYVPLAVIIAEGIKPLIRHRSFIVVPLVLVCLFSLYRSMVLLRFERASDWLYPYRQLSQTLSKISDETVIIDNSRIKPLYIYYAYVNQVSPKEVQSWRQLDLSQYYNHYDYIEEMKFGNLQVKPLSFRQDIYQEGYLVADPIGISAAQAEEHHLTKTDSITNLDGTVAFNVYRTDPKDKCQSAIALGLVPPPICANYLK